MSATEPIDRPISTLMARRPRTFARDRDARIIFAIALLTLVSATVSRTLVALGAPRVLDFVHIPMVLCMAAMSTRLVRQVPACRRAFLWLSVLFVVGEAGWVAAGGELVRPLAGWVLLAEPLLFAVPLAAVLWSQPDPHDRLALRLELGVLGLAVAQLPFGLVQLVTKGVGDPVQGTFIKLGSGAHVAGALTFVGALSAAGLALRGHRRRTLLWATTVALFLMSIATDAKQVLVAAIPAYLVLVWLADFSIGRVALSRKGSQRRAKIAFISLAACLFAVIFATYTPLRHTGSEPKVSRGSEGKLDAARLITKRMDDRPETFLVGLGPGNTVSKLATLTKGADLRSDSPVSFLHLAQSDLTREIRSLDKADYILASSSVFSGLSSLVGLFGDLGILGILAYSLAWYALAQPALRRRGNDRAVAAAAITATVILSYVNVWLEEPNFMLPLAALLVSTAARGGRRSRQR